jgi:hypothetical protein
MAEFDAEEAVILSQRLADHRAEVYQNFSGLTFFPPKPSKNGGNPEFDRREILAQIKQSSLLTGERRRFRRIVKLMRQARLELPPDLTPVKAKRKLIELQEKKLFLTYSCQYGLDNMEFCEFQRLTHEAIKRTSKYLEQLLNAYVPINHRGQLAFAASVFNARDFPSLIALAGTKAGRGVISKRIGHEARVMAVFAQLEFEHLIGVYNPDRVDAIRRDLISIFENNVFDPGLSQRLVVVAELDPANDYRVKRDAEGKPRLAIYGEDAPEAHQTSTASLLVLPRDVRVINCNGRLVPVYFLDRHKEMIFAKLLRKLCRDPAHITDHSAFTCVLFGNGSDEEALANKLRDEIVVNPGQVSAQKSNAARAGAIDPHNLHSSLDRRGESYIFRWGGINHELQILDIATFIDSMICRNRISHLFYKFLTLVDTAFPFIWPKELYGKDWLDAGFRDILWEYLVKELWTGPEDPEKISRISQLPPPSPLTSEGTTAPPDAPR